MAYTPNPDDILNPVLSTPAGTAQAEFIALKQKLNNLFLKSDYKTALQEQPIKAGTSYVGALPGSNTDVGIMYGHAVNITRNDIAGTGAQVVAAQLSAILGNNLDGLAKNISVFGAATEAWTSPIASQAALIGFETSVISQFNANEMALVGADVVFKNRSDALYGGAVLQGLGANQYNKFSRGLQFSAQPRSTAGENCGWHNGIIFQPGSLDYAKIGGVNVPGCAIDIATANTVPATSEPWTAHKFSSALALGEYMSVTWDYLRFTRSYLDSTNNRLVMLGIGNSPTTVPLLAYNYVTNNIELPGTTVGATPGAATASMRIKIGATNYYIALTAA